MRVHRTAIAASLASFVLTTAACAKAGADSPKLAKVDGASSRHHKVSVQDPVYGMEAGTMEIPANWKFAGTIARGGGCTSNGPAIKYSTESADGLTAVEFFPGFAWSWSADPSFARALKSQNCALFRATSAASFLKDVALPKLRPNAQVVSIDPPDAKWQARIDARRSQMQSQSAQMASQYRQAAPENIIDGATARLTSSYNGQPVDEELATLTICSVTHMLGGGYPMRPIERHQCQAAYMLLRRAPQGTMSKERPGLISIAETYKASEAWSQQIAEDGKKMAEKVRNASDAAGQQILRNGEEQQRIRNANHKAQMDVQQRGVDLSMKRDRENQNAIDTAAKQQELNSLDRQTYVDPSTGKKVETTNQYNHVWRSGDGQTVLHTNEPTYDPNGRDNQTWTELQPTTP